jgi:hypothetical protein
MMERRFLMNDFEQSLKEHADEFKMIPSKRVWHGIYNDMHPGRRWPSVPMSLALIFTLVVIGHLNTHNGSQTLNSKNISLHSEKVLSNLKPGEISKIAQKTGSQTNVSRKTNVITSDVSQPEDIESKPETNINNYSPNNNNLITDDLLVQNLKLTAQSGSTEFEKNILFFPEQNDNWNYVENNILDNKNIQSQNNSVKPNTISETIKGKIAINNSDNLQSDQPITIENTNLLHTKFVSDNKNNNIDNDIVKNKPDEIDKKSIKLKQKKNDKISWVYFVAPQVNSVSFSGAPIKPLNTTNNSPVVAINQRDYKVLHNSALGFEAGTQINYTLAKKLMFTSGLHITYSGYNIISNEVHPTFANLFLKDPETGNVYSKNYITHYGSGSGQSVVSIRNYNLQASIPIGLQYGFLGNNKVQLNADANFEPSMVIKSNGYILSSDGNNYVNDPDLLRKFNMSSNFGVFVTFNSSKFKWQIGPNVRYQWLSTYKKDFTVREHLIDYGIRIGISPIRK